MKRDPASSLHAHTQSETEKRKRRTHTATSTPTHEIHTPTNAHMRRPSARRGQTSGARKKKKKPPRRRTRHETGKEHAEQRHAHVEPKLGRQRYILFCTARRERTKNNAQRGASPRQRQKKNRRKRGIGTQQKHQQRPRLPRTFVKVLVAVAVNNFGLLVE